MRIRFSQHEICTNLVSEIDICRCQIFIRRTYILFLTDNERATKLKTHVIFLYGITHLLCSLVIVSLCMLYVFLMSYISFSYCIICR